MFGCDAKRNRKVKPENKLSVRNTESSELDIKCKYMRILLDFFNMNFYEFFRFYFVVTQPILMVNFVFITETVYLCFIDQRLLFVYSSVSHWAICRQSLLFLLKDVFVSVRVHKYLK